MHFGIYLSTVDPFSNAALLADLAHEAETVGWDGVFIWDHIGHPSTGVDPWVALAAMAVRTRRVKLGPIVTPVARRRPWKLARETVAVDQLSGGRLILGVGLGWSVAEFEAFGEEGDPKIRAAKLDEGLDVLAELWKGEPVTHDGAHFHLHNVCLLPPPVQSPRIPIWVCGAWSDKRAPFRRAARWDGVVAIAPSAENRAITPDEIREVRTYVGRHRTVVAPFDTVVILWSEGDHSQSERDAVAAYADAGATWWLEDLSTERFAALSDVRRRLHAGPPTG